MPGVLSEGGRDPKEERPREHKGRRAATYKPRSEALGEINNLTP